jgi:PKD repeat protein
MKKTLLILCGAMLTLSGFSQKCLTDQMLEARFEQTPGLREEAHRFMSNLAEKENNKATSRAADTLITLPVVFHIIHDNGKGNITEDQVADAIRVLNRDLNKNNTDTTETREIFKPFAAKANIEFRIAKLDPDGFCTNGITRHNLGAVSYDARDDIKRSSTGGVDAWPVDRYFNVWVVNSIEASGGTGEGIVLGYAQFPFSFGGGVNATYGIVARQDYLGTIGTSNDDGRMLTHEVGHCLGLFHTFQGGCSTNCAGGGDYICDTPPTSEATYGCDFAQNTCTDPLDDPYDGAIVVDQIENYMSYDGCTNMFSEGQKARMRGVVTNNVVFFGQQQNIPQMESLTSAENLEATGVYLPGEPCQVIFESNTNYTCVNTPIKFTDFSFAKISNWQWSFPGGTPLTSQEKNPTVTYDTPGTYSVSLIIGDSAGNFVDSTYTDHVTITATDVLSGPYEQGFEGSLNMNSFNWYSVNTSNDNVAWKITANAGKNSDQSLFINNFNTAQVGYVDYVISDAFDLSAMPNATFIYDQCYAMKNTNNSENFKIEISNNCGVTWTSLVNKSGFGIGPSNIDPNNSYVPGNANWRNFLVSIPNQFLTTGVKFKITLISGGGNNFYLDNLNIASNVSVQEIGAANNLIVYPNPFTDNTSLVITSAKRDVATLSLRDMLGKEAKSLSNIEVSVGENKINLDRENLPAGVYLLQVNFESGQQVTKKLIIK